MGNKIKDFAHLWFRLGIKSELDHEPFEKKWDQFVKDLRFDKKLKKRFRKLKRGIRFGK